MPARSIRKKRGTAEPRWGWSGPAQVIPPKLSPADIARVRATLPRRIPIRQIIVELRELGGRFHRRLHQDEFGPSRAESMAALRALADRFDVLTLSLSELPTSSRLWLCEQLAVTVPPVSSWTWTLILVSMRTMKRRYGDWPKSPLRLVVRHMRC